MDTGITVAFTGHRPKDLPPSYSTSDLYKSESWRSVINTVKEQLKSLKATTAISGMAQGFDTAAALAVLSLRDEEHYPISLHLEIPCPGQESLWPQPDQLLYHSILSKADTVHYIVPPGHVFPGKYIFLLRNKKMVDQADTVIALWTGKETGGTYQTINYAKREHKPIINIWAQQ